MTKKKESIGAATSDSGSNRRQFFSILLPSCAVTCLGFNFACSSKQTKVASAANAAPSALHPFDAELKKPITYRQFFAAQYMGAIELGKALQKEMGSEEALDFLRRHTSQKLHEYGKSQAVKAGDQSLRQYTEQFRKLENYRNTLVMEIVEDTEKAFEIKVTECIWASVFRQADAGDLGSAMICHGDYAWAKGFSPKIELVRDKTLMQGDAICNHRYVWQTV